MTTPLAMEPVAWTAEMITPAGDITAPLLRREVTLDPGHGAVQSAMLHVSSLGVFEAFVNGVPVAVFPTLAA